MGRRRTVVQRLVDVIREDEGATSPTDQVAAGTKHQEATRAALAKRREAQKREAQGKAGSGE